MNRSEVQSNFTLTFKDLSTKIARQLPHRPPRRWPAGPPRRRGRPAPCGAARSTRAPCSPREASWRRASSSVGSITISSGLYFWYFNEIEGGASTEIARFPPGHESIFHPIVTLSQMGEHEVKLANLGVTEWMTLFEDSNNLFLNLLGN